MKISQYILLSFIGFLVAAVMVLFIDSIGKEDYSSFPPLNGNVELGTTLPEKYLGDFSVIVVEDEANIMIKNDSINRIDATLFKSDNDSELPNYRVKDDTLFISKSNYKTKTIIHCKSVKTIISQKKSHILFKDYKTDSLTVYANNSIVRGWLVNKSMQYINVEANNDTNMSVIVAQPINTCELKIDSSFVRLHGKDNKVVNLKTTLKNNSKMELKSVEKSEIDCDSLSTYQIYNYNE